NWYSIGGSGGGLHNFPRCDRQRTSGSKTMKLLTTLTLAALLTAGASFAADPKQTATPASSATPAAAPAKHESTAACEKEAKEKKLTGAEKEKIVEEQYRGI